MLSLPHPYKHGYPKQKEIFKKKPLRLPSIFIADSPALPVLLASKRNASNEVRF